MKSPRPESFLSVAEAAERLGVSRWRVNQFIAAGRLPAVKIGRAYVIRVPDLSKVADRKIGRPSQQKNKSR